MAHCHQDRNTPGECSSGSFLIVAPLRVRDALRDLSETRRTTPTSPIADEAPFVAMRPLPSPSRVLRAAASTEAMAAARDHRSEAAGRRTRRVSRSASPAHGRRAAAEPR